MKKAIKIYVASPLGFSEVSRYFYEKVFLSLIKTVGFTILDPWQLTSQARIDKVIKLPYGMSKKQAWVELNKVIGTNNAEAIQACDCVVAVLDGVDVDSGTASEIGFAAALGKPIIGYRGDFRLSADNEGSIVNLQVEYFIKMNGGEIVTNLLELKKVLIKMHSVL